MHEVSLHEGLERINDGAFYKCGFSSITIPASVSIIGKEDNTCRSSVWGHCPNLKNIYVVDNNPYYCSINGVLFTKDKKNLVAFPCKREGSYNIPIGTEAINPCAFYSSELEEIVFPESLKALGDNAFQFMENLKKFTIPNTITTIGEGVFWGCFNLKDVAIEGNRFEIPEGMFYNCSSLNSIHLPEEITSIGAHAFELNGKLTEITIPSKVTYIGESAFAYTDLRRVTCLMETPCAISSTVFEGTNVNPILYVPEQSIAAYKEADNWKNFSQILPIGQNVIEPYAELYNGVLTFYNDNNRDARIGTVYEIPSTSGFNSYANWADKNGSITKVIFDASFADARPTITQAWFDGCEKLTEIQGLENLNTSEVTNMSGMFQNCQSLVSLDLSSFKTSRVTSMSAMFWGCSNLKTIILPDDLTFIDSYQFVYCSSLTDISIPSSVTSIGECAFHYCTSLEEITIPADVTSIGDNAFSYSGLTKVKSLMQAPCGISSTVFENVINNATLYVPAGCKTAYEAADYWKDFKKIMGPTSNLIYMVDGEEYRSYEIEHGSTITPEPAPTKEGYNFSGWSEIPATMPTHDVTITGTFTQIDYVVGETTYVIQNDEVSVKDGSKLSGNVEIQTTVVINDQTYKVTSIADNAFKGNTAITSVTIPNSITQIGTNAFEGCTSLSEINIGNAVSSIGSKAFANITSASNAPRRASGTGLKVSCYAESVPSTASNAFENTSISNGTLLVEDNSVTAYKNSAPWSGFGTIMGFKEATGIDAIIIDIETGAKIYSLDGKPQNAFQKGINIVRTSNGKTKKVVIK